MVFEKMDIRAVPDDPFQRLLDDMSGRIGGMDNAPLAVATFTCQVIAGLGGLVSGKGNTLIDQPVDGFPAMLDNKPGSDFIAQPGTGRQGILDMLFDTVQNRVQNGGDSSLGEIACTFPQCPLADQGDFVCFGKTQRNGQSRQSATDNNDIEIHDFSTGMVMVSETDTIFH